MSYYPEFADLLNNYLNLEDRTISWLAKRLNVHHATVGRWLNEGTRPGSPETIIRMADILGIHDSRERQALLVAAGYGYIERSQNEIVRTSTVKPPEFSSLLNQYLYEQERSSSWLARRLGLSASTVSNWQNGQSRPSKPETVIRAAEVLGIDGQERQALLVAAGHGYEESREDEIEIDVSDSLTSLANTIGENSVVNIDHGQFHFNGHTYITLEASTAQISTPFMARQLPPQGPLVNIDHGQFHFNGKTYITVGGSAAQISAPFMTPQLELQGVVGRDDILGQIVELMELDNANTTKVPPIALHGMGGIGKTTLAIAVGQQDMISDFFPDGVLWVALGPNPNIRLLLDSWGRALGVDLQSERDEKACRERLRSILHQRRVLLLIDDVWQVEHGKSFMLGGSHCRTLLTTRESPVAYNLATRQRTLRVDLLSPEASLDLLHRLAPEAVEMDEKKAKQLCERVEYLPLALTLVGRRLAAEADVPSRMQRLMEQLISQHQGQASALYLTQKEERLGLNGDQPVSIKAIFGLSVQRLEQADQKRFAMASIFGGEPLTWALDEAADMWASSIEEAEDTTAHFIQRGLVVRRDNRYWMHALLADYGAEMMDEMGWQKD